MKTHSYNSDEWIILFFFHYVPFKIFSAHIRRANQ